MSRSLSNHGLRLVVSLLLSLVLVVGGVAGVDTAPPNPEISSSTPPPVHGVQIDPDNVLLQVALQPNGTGDWRVEYRIRLDDENATEAFERHRAQIESDPERYRERFATDMRATIETAENATGREMSLANVTVDVESERLPQRYGIITYTFEWHGFAATNGSSIEAGDALEGIFLDSETTLLVTWSDGFHRISVSPPPHEERDRGVVWAGPTHFGANEPSIRIAQDGPTEPRTVTGTTGGETDQARASTSPLEGRRDGNGPPSESAGRVPVLVGMGLFALVLLALLGAAYGGYLERPLRGGADEPTGGGDVPAELLSNEEQVLSLLKERGGRLKQQEVAAALGWTDAKTSKVVGQMRGADQIETFRIGRENVVTLPDTDLTEDNI